jgi:hypothetical protein
VISDSPFYDLRGRPFKRRFACGSMVLLISSVVHFSLGERKMNNKKKMKYRSAEG